MFCAGFYYIQHFYLFGIMSMNEYIQFGLLTVGIFTFLLYFIQYRRNNKKAALDDELANLSQAFMVEELHHPSYISKSVSYPAGLTSEVYHANEEMSVFDGFYEYVRKAASYLSDTEFTRSQMVALYDKYTSNLNCRDRLDLTFQVLYSCIHGIVSAWGFKSVKSKQLGRVQNTLTSKQQIYYYFNQIHYYDRQRIYNNYISKELFEYEFFKKMFESESYKQIQSQIPLCVEQLFYKQEKRK